METNPKTIKEIRNIINSSLAPYYPDREIQSFISLIFEHLFNYSNIDLHLNSHRFLDGETEMEIDYIIRELSACKPIQYILGKTEFLGISFEVNDKVLIPRPETEELVNLILKNHDEKKLKILDIGTGSGVIAVSLAKFLNDPVIAALDIDREALGIAIKNADLNDVKVNFLQFDVLSDNLFPGNDSFDIIVSNPPYIRNSEKIHMSENVLKYEPAIALFVDDEDPLIFYRAIARFCIKHLKNKGKLYLEINESLGIGTAKLLDEYGFGQTELFKDINGRYRLIQSTLIK